MKTIRKPSFKEAIIPIIAKEAGIEIQNENRFIAAVIASIYVRMNGLTYNMTSKAKIHKAEAK